MAEVPVDDSSGAESRGVFDDNGASHVSRQTKAWFATHPRWVVHYTPPHASWVNQVELFFLEGWSDLAPSDDLSWPHLAHAP